VLTGKRIGEPIVRHGPFVMNTKDEIRACRTNSTWQIIKPLVYPAQGMSIEALLAEWESLEQEIAGLESD